MPGVYARVCTVAHGNLAVAHEMPVAHGLWPTAFGPGAVAHGLWPTGCGPLAVAHGLWPTGAQHLEYSS